MTFAISIDSAKQLRYTGVMSGDYKNIFEFYGELEKILAPKGIKPPFHWSKLTNKQRMLCRNSIVSLINDSPRLKINIFDHKIPQGVSHKDYYLFHIPNCISENLESWIKSHRKDCDIEIIVNEDYNISHHKNGTDIFIDNLLKQIGSRSTGKTIAIIKNTRRDKKVRATIKLLNGSVIDFYASKMQIKDSKEIQLIDVILGYYCDNSDDFDPNRVYFRKI
jgi:hypothetical protein